MSGSLTAAVTSNGASHKVAGRVGDAPIVGAGGYAADGAGCAAATGDGDITQRFLPAFYATEQMRMGRSPQEACDAAVRRIMAKVSDFSIGLVCLSPSGEHAASAHGWQPQQFGYCHGDEHNDVRCEKVTSLV